MKVWIRGGAAIVIRGRLIALRPPGVREYWSERNRIGWRVLYLPFGWRLSTREAQKR